MSCSDIKFSITEENLGFQNVTQDIGLSEKTEQVNFKEELEQLNVSIKEEHVEFKIGGGVTNITITGPYWKQDLFTLNSTQITNKQVSLSETPYDADSMDLKVYKGATQIQTIDFSVSGSTLSWSGTVLEDVLEVGDIISARYNYI